jgi:hypothetical protein
LVFFTFGLFAVLVDLFLMDFLTLEDLLVVFLDLVLALALVFLVTAFFLEAAADFLVLVVRAFDLDVLLGIGFVPLFLK